MPDLLRRYRQQLLKLMVDQGRITVVKGKLRDRLRSRQRRLAHSDRVVDELVLELLHLLGRRAVGGEIANFLVDGLADLAEVLVRLRNSSYKNARRPAALVGKAKELNNS